MIIWRGWGFLAVVYIAVCAGMIGGGLASTVVSDGAVPVTVGLGFMVGGVLTAVHGWYLNTVRPQAKASEWELAERPRLEAAADQGTLVVDSVQPRDRAEAEAMIDSLIADGRRVIGRHGPHSVFWIPMEIIGILALVGGLLLGGYHLFMLVLG